MKSKRQLVTTMLERAVEDAIKSVAFDSPDHRNALAQVTMRLKHQVVSRIVWDDYRWLELQDIMAWRKRAIKD